MNFSQEQWLTRKEAAAKSQYSLSTIDRAIQRKALRKVHNGVRRVRIALSELMRFMDSQKPQGSQHVAH